MKLVIIQVALGSRVWSLAVTSRTVSISSAWNKVPETLESPEHAKLEESTPSSTSALLKDFERAKDSTLSKNLEVAKSSTRSKDPELARQRRNAYLRTRLAFRRANDPVFRERDHLKKKTWYLEQRADPEWYAKRKEQMLEIYYTRFQADPYVAIQHALRNWFYQSHHIRDRLSWEKHVPVMTTEKIERHCASCHAKRRGGFRLWWQRRQSLGDGESLYDCPACFLSNPETALPQGFEDVKTLQQLFLRREQLLGIKANLRKHALPPPST